MAISILLGGWSVWICRMIWILFIVNYDNKAVSTLVMVICEQDYRGTTLSMEECIICHLSRTAGLQDVRWFNCDIEQISQDK